MAAGGDAGDAMSIGDPTPVLYEKLSALTPEVVDALYHIDSALPPMDRPPTFLFLVGVPGAGKSSGHAYAFEKGYLEPGNYVTVNLDTLLESLTPFRAASSMAHLLREDPNLRKHADFASIVAYLTHKENLGLFKWYNTGRNAMEAIRPNVIGRLNRVREKYRKLQDVEEAPSLVDINDDALGRAIGKGVDIVYETTFSLTKGTAKNPKITVTKVDKVMDMIAKTKIPYRVIIVYVGGNPEDVAARVHMRQHYEMPHMNYPFFRYVPSTTEGVMRDMTAMRNAVEVMGEKYKGRIEVDFGFINIMDPSRLPPKRPIVFEKQLERIEAAYGPKRGGSRRTRVRRHTHRRRTIRRR